MDDKYVRAFIVALFVVLFVAAVFSGISLRSLKTIEVHESKYPNGTYIKQSVEVIHNYTLFNVYTAVFIFSGVALITTIIVLLFVRG